MAYYRVYLLNAADHIHECLVAQHDDDDAVISAAALLLPANPAVEIWLDARKVAYLAADKQRGDAR